jgi:hypothetical protein
LSHNLGVSDLDIVNLFKVTAKGEGYGLFDYMFPPIELPSSIQQHGVRKFYPETIYPFRRADNEKGTKRSDQSIKDTLTGLTRNIYRWYCMNDFLKNGSISTGELRNDIRIGNRLKFTDIRTGDTEMYMIESVMHQFRFGSPSTTSLGVTRGLPAKSNPRYKGFLNVMDERLAAASPKSVDPETEVLS